MAYRTANNISYTRLASTDLYNSSVMCELHYTFNVV